MLYREILSVLFCENQTERTYKACVKKAKLLQLNLAVHLLAISSEPSKAQWLLYVPPGLTFSNSAFCPHTVFMCFFVDLRTNSDYYPIQH